MFRACVGFLSLMCWGELEESASVPGSSAIRIPAIHLLNSPLVRAELKLDESASSEMHRLFSEFEQAARLAFMPPMPEDGRKPPPFDYKAYTRKREELTAAFSAKASGLLTEDQTTRLLQVQWQLRSVWRYVDPDFIKLLELSDTQKKELQTELAAFDRSARALLKDVSAKRITSVDARARAIEIQDDAIQTIEGRLDDRQRTLQAVALGQPISFRKQDVPTTLSLMRKPGKTAPMSD